MKNKINQKQHFYNVRDTYTEKFYQLPQVFFTSPRYQKLSNDAKIAYTLLKDRNNYSIKNNWFDEEGNIYFIFTIEELKTLLRCGSQKATKIKKELEDFGLLFQKRMGLRKPNRLYLLRPEITAEDAYIQANEEAEMQEKLGKQRQEDQEQIQNRQTQKSPSVKADEPTKTEVSTGNYFDIFTKNNTNLIGIIARNTDLEESDIRNVIFAAKNKALRDEGYVARILDIKDFQGFIGMTLQNIISSLKDKNIENVKGYLYISVYKGFAKFAKAYREWMKTASIEDLAQNITEQDLVKITRSLPVE